MPIEEKEYLSYIVDSKELIDNADSLILEYQKGIKRPIKFQREWINKTLLGGLFPGNVIGIAGSSGHGKSTLLQDLEDDILNKELNPRCDDYVLVKNNYEMSVFKLYLRELKKATNKKITEILGSEFTEEEEIIVQKVKEKESDKRIKYFEYPQTPELWYKIMRGFCRDNKDKEHIVVTIDHIALVKQTSIGKKDGIDNLIEYINLLRHEFSNISFLILSQLNRNIEERDNPKNSAPKKMDLYQSDFLFQLSDVIIVVHNPYKLGLEEHMVVGSSQYSEFSMFKKDPTKKTSTFKTKGLIFFHIIKMREDEDGTLSDLYIERLNRIPPSGNIAGALPSYEPNSALFDEDIDDDLQNLYD